MLEVVSYAKAFPIDANVHQPSIVRDQAEAMGFNDVTIAQVVGNGKLTPRCSRNYQVREWALCGMLERLHDLPTVFDRRDREGEADAVSRYVPHPDGRPLLAYNLTGKSSEYKHAGIQREWIDSSFPGFRKIDVGAICLPKIHHLLGILDVADVLISTDTSTLHLAHATMTPTVAFVSDKPSGASEARQHWIYACPYAQSIMTKHREAIASLLSEPIRLTYSLMRSLDDMAPRRVYHGVDYTWADEDEKKRVLDAYRTWDQIRFTDGDSFRTIFTEHGPEWVAMLTEVIDACFAEPFDAVVLWAHRYTSLPPEVLELARRMDVEACEILPGVFAMTGAWWTENRAMLAGVMAEDGEEAMRMAMMREIPVLVDA